MPEPLKAVVRRRLDELQRGAIEAARKGGLERTYIIDILRGSKLSVSDDRLPQVARALDWTVEEFLRARGIIGPAAEDNHREKRDTP